MPLRNMILVVAAMTLPRLTWSLYWQAAQLGSYSQNETHPAEALAAWFDSARTGEGLSKIKGYALLAGHGALNVGAAFLFWPVLLAVWELWCRRRSAEAAWFVAVAVAGFAPALFMLSTWPHIPRWYAYGFPAVYILTAAAAVRIARWLIRTDRPLPLARWLVRTDRPAPVVPSLMRTERPVNLAFVGLAVLVVLPAVVLANLDLVGSTRPMELVLFQPTHWSYLWSP
jgi:hypothetical protein